jgi:PPOX class probable F420-dependent enzyme
MQIDPSTPFGAKVLHKLENEQVIWLITVGASGMPYPSPVWFLAEDDKCLLIYTRADAPKLKNIAERPNVALHFNSDFDGHDVVSFSGTAVVIDEPTPSDQIPEYQTKYAKGIEGLNMTPAQFAAAYSGAIRVTLTKIRGM